jgi:DNA-directed RNA polymerase subunit RPC12/RpoP
MINFDILTNQNILFGRGKNLTKIEVKCDNCGGKFTMGRTVEIARDYTTKVQYEYNYCPHCANKLVVQE